MKSLPMLAFGTPTDPAKPPPKRVEEASEMELFDARRSPALAPATPQRPITALFTVTQAGRTDTAVPTWAAVAPEGRSRMR